MSSGRRQGEDRILTFPNALSALRLACLPVFIVLLAQPHGKGRLAAAFLLGASAFTDGLDGFVARHFNQVSTLGKMADPLVDRALVLGGALFASLGAAGITLALRRAGGAAATPALPRAHREGWRMPPLALLGRPEWSRSRTLAMRALSVYLAVAVVLLLVKAVQLGSTH